MIGSIQRNVSNNDTAPKVNIVLHTATLVSHIYCWYINDLVCIHWLVESCRLPTTLCVFVCFSTVWVVKMLNGFIPLSPPASHTTPQNCHVTNNNSCQLVMYTLLKASYNCCKTIISSTICRWCHHAGQVQHFHKLKFLAGKITASATCIESIFRKLVAMSRMQQPIASCKYILYVAQRQDWLARDLSL